MRWFVALPTVLAALSAVSDAHRTAGLTVNLPRAGTQWSRGNYESIVWTVSDKRLLSSTPLVDLELWKTTNETDIHILTIAKQQSIADGYTNWMVPNVVRTSNRYRLVMRASKSDTITPPDPRPGSMLVKTERFWMRASRTWIVFRALQSGRDDEPLIDPPGSDNEEGGGAVTNGTTTTSPNGTYVIGSGPEKAISNYETFHSGANVSVRWEMFGPGDEFPAVIEVRLIAVEKNGEIVVDDVAVDVSPSSKLVVWIVPQAVSDDVRSESFIPTVDQLYVLQVIDDETSKSLGKSLAFKISWAEGMASVDPTTSAETEHDDDDDDGSWLMWLLICIALLLIIVIAVWWWKGYWYRRNAREHELERERLARANLNAGQMSMAQWQKQRKLKTNISASNGSLFDKTVRGEGSSNTLAGSSRSLATTSVKQQQAGSATTIDMQGGSEQKHNARTVSTTSGHSLNSLVFDNSEWQERVRNARSQIDTGRGHSQKYGSAIIESKPLQSSLSLASLAFVDRYLGEDSLSASTAAPAAALASGSTKGYIVAADSRTSLRQASTQPKPEIDNSWRERIKSVQSRTDTGRTHAPRRHRPDAAATSVMTNDTSTKDRYAQI